MLFDLYYADKRLTLFLAPPQQQQNIILLMKKFKKQSFRPEPSDIQANYLSSLTKKTDDSKQAETNNLFPPPMRGHATLYSNG